MDRRLKIIIIIIIIIIILRPKTETLPRDDGMTSFRVTDV